MQGKNRSNVLLVEILVALLFFMLSATILVQVFATARTQNVTARTSSFALQEVQNVAEMLYVSEDPEETLAGLGFTEGHGVWTRRDADFTLYVNMGMRDYESGSLFRAEISAYYLQDTLLFTLPVEKYRPPVTGEADAA